MGYNCYVYPLNGWIVSFNEQVLRPWELRCSDTSAKVNLSVAVKSDFSWLVTYHESTMETDKCTALSHLPAVLGSGTITQYFDFARVCVTIVDKLQGLLKLLDRCSAILWEFR